MTQLQKIQCLIRWANSEDAPETFDDGFIKKLEESHKEYGRLTERQELALDNIIDCFRVDVALYR